MLGLGQFEIRPRDLQLLPRDLDLARPRTRRELVNNRGGTVALGLRLADFLNAETGLKAGVLGAVRGKLGLCFL